MNRRELLKLHIAGIVAGAFPMSFRTALDTGRIDVVKEPLDLKNTRYGNFITYYEEVDSAFVRGELVRSLEQALPKGTPYKIFGGQSDISDPFGDYLTMGWKAGKGIDGPLIA